MQMCLYEHDGDEQLPLFHFLQMGGGLAGIGGEACCTLRDLGALASCLCFCSLALLH